MFPNRLRTIGCSLIKRTDSVLLNCCRAITSEPNFLETVCAARTSLQPESHTTNHVGMWYTVPPDTAQRLYNYYGLNYDYKDICKIVNETSFIVRKPGLSIIDMIKRSNLDQLPIKYVLYGRKGYGKTLTLAMLMHYLHDDDWIITHFYNPPFLATLFKEIVPSLTRPDFYDHTVDATKYLRHFLSQNLQKLEKKKLTTSKAYEWSKRESTPAGVPLTTLIDVGIQRAKYASEVVHCLHSELKLLSTEGRCKVAVVVDGINAFFHPISLYTREDKSIVPVKQFTFFEAFRIFLDKDWKNGCILTSVNLEMSTKDRRKSLLPRYLLRKEGWEMMDPFIPLFVDKFDDHELNSIVNYYLEKKWLQHPESGSPDGREEFKYISGGNGYDLLYMINAH